MYKLSTPTLMHNIAATRIQRRRGRMYISLILRRTHDVKTMSHQHQRILTSRRPQHNPIPTPNVRQANTAALRDHKKIGQDEINGILGRHAKNILRQSLMSSSFCKRELQPENR